MRISDWSSDVCSSDLPGGYQLGNFPPGWSELNDKFRDAVRQYWKGDDGMLPEMAARLAGSADLFDHRGRRPWTSVNKITSHDGFTLNDWASYNDKHNEANGEGNQDGHDANYSWNHGVEGPTEDPAIVELRERQKRNMLATDRKSTRLNSSHSCASRMPSSA